MKYQNITISKVQRNLKEEIKQNEKQKQRIKVNEEKKKQPANV